MKTSANTVDEIEESVISEHAGQLRVFPKEIEKRLIKGLMKTLAEEKADGETVTTFEERLNLACESVFEEGSRD